MRRKRNELSIENMLAIESCLPGFSWFLQDRRPYEEWVGLLQRFKNTEGRPPKGTELFDGIKLGQWYLSKRIINRRGKLDKDRHNMIETVFPGLPTYKEYNAQKADPAMTIKIETPLIKVELLKPVESAHVETPLIKIELLESAPVETPMEPTKPAPLGEAIMIKLTLL